MSSEDYTEPPKVPAWKVRGYVFYAGGNSDPLTSTAPTVKRAKNNILYRWAHEEMRRKSPPIGSQVMVISAERVYVSKRVRVLVAR